MAKDALTSEVQVYIVQALACFDAPSIVVKALREEFALELTRQRIETYDPTKRAGQKLSDKHRLLFEETRKAFLEDTSRIGISHRAVRLRALHRMAEKAEGMSNLALAAQLHKQAAEEVGGSFTNRRELTGKDGKDLPAQTAQIVIQVPDNGR